MLNPEIFYHLSFIIYHFPVTTTLAPSTAGRFPLGLCIASITTTSLGLSAAALGIKWGAAPPPGDALQSAWLYVHEMLMFTLLVIWPALDLLPHRANPSCAPRRDDPRRD